MRNLIRPVLAIILASVLLVSGCESVDQKAEKKYQSALSLVQSGQTAKALVELQSVFKLNGQHRDARMLYASLKEQSKDYEQAFGHYLLVVEQYPDDFEALLKLAEMSVELNAWSEAEKHTLAAAALRPDDPSLRPLLVAVDYARAARGSDDAAMDDAYTRAREVLKEKPETIVAWQVVIDRLARQNEPYKALEAVTEALEYAPESAQFHQIKLNLLAQVEDFEGLGAQLKVMVEQFPENGEVRTALVRWYIANGDPDGAETFVRELVAKAGDEVPPRLALVQFLSQVRGVDAALAELELLIDEGLDDSSFRLLKASLLFDKGERELAIGQVEDLIKEKSSSDVVRNMKTTLARMLLADGDKLRAQALVGEVLAEDPGDQAALKMKAAWLIEDDQVRDAVLALRTALDQAPRDPETITLLARAYERGGNRELMADSLALAFEASNAAPAESLRYASYLIGNEKYLAAEDVLLRAVRLSPTNIDLMRSLSEVYMGMNDLPRAEQVVTALRQVGTDDALVLANSIQAAVLQRSARTDESIRLMQNMIEEGQSTLAAQTAIIRTRLANGELTEARAYMDEVIANTPEDSPNITGVRFLNAALTATEGKFTEARAMYREILAADDTVEPVWRALVATAVREGKQDEAEGIVDEALAVVPDSANLWWIKAGLAERNGRIDDAIAIYEDLYAKDSNSTIIANNLASLITTFRDDAESLERAFVIARRLRGSTIPAFQDTYGWIAYRLGNLDEALENLEPAAQRLPNDPTVQYHLAKTYDALDRPADAKTYLERAVGLWETSELELAATARAELAAMGDVEAPAAAD
ncbi:MAG: tetratricopeptide repeat protein [Rhodobacteraceae bacterium]|nr:tetratricopeptide repeat protein [Paracoccaceae bacterium]